MPWRCRISNGRELSLSRARDCWRALGYVSQRESSGTCGRRRAGRRSARIFFLTAARERPRLRLDGHDRAFIVEVAAGGAFSTETWA